MYYFSFSNLLERYKVVKETIFVPMCCQDLKYIHMYHIRQKKKEKDETEQKVYSVSELSMCQLEE